MNNINNKWYISTQNKAKGPYTDLQMREKIQSGELKEDVLTYKEGEPDWLPLKQQDIWTPGFIPKHPLESRDSKDWVLLVESPIKQGDYEQQGPFTQEEVEEKVSIGEVHLKDFCWRPGMEGWKALVETSELGFPRREKITFEEKEGKGEAESSAKFFKGNKRKSIDLGESLLDLKSQMPDFVPPEELTQKEVEVEPVKSFRTRFLPPIIDRQGERREVALYLALVAACFLGAFYIGTANSTNVLKGVEAIGTGIASFAQKILPATPKVSYVFLRELPLTRGTILVKTDGKPGINIVARLKDENGNTVRTLNGEKSLKLQANKNGEAFLGLSQFKVQVGKTYLVTTKAGQLTAKKTYFYSKK
ncbi:MAG: DUF4339 domain-containing protein [Bdellovibrionales bacterium]